MECPRSPLERLVRRGHCRATRICLSKARMLSVHENGGRRNMCIARKTGTPLARILCAPGEQTRRRNLELDWAMKGQANRDSKAWPSSELRHSRRPCSSSDE
jgi:hypothetical protein